MGGSGICSRKASAQAGAPAPMLIAPRFAARVARVLVDPNGCAANTERWAAVEVAEQVAEVPVTEADATVEAAVVIAVEAAELEPDPEDKQPLYLCRAFIAPRASMRGTTTSPLDGASPDRCGRAGAKV